MFQQARYGGAADCRNKFFTSASAAKKEYERQCEVIGEAVECVAKCALKNFVGANADEIVVNAHEEVIINRLNRIARETANKHAKRFLPVVGQYDTYNDALGTIECTTDCTKR
jgi:hypothetical protein